MSIKMVVGLGNPGKKYDNTRHNVGRQLIDGLRGASLPVVLVQTESFMNESGHEVQLLAKKKGILPNEILVVLDEFQIPLRQVRILKSGSDGGHNGLKSIIESLGTADIPRLRIGIGPLPPEGDPADFVLQRFSRDEQKSFDDISDELQSAITAVVEQGIDAAMNKYNNRTL